MPECRHRGTSVVEKKPAGDSICKSLLELPARSVDLSALNLTELVNGMLSRALKGDLRRGPRVALWVEHLTLDFDTGHDLTVRDFESRIRL